MEKDLRTACVCVLMAFEQTDFIDAGSPRLVVPIFNKVAVCSHKFLILLLALVIGVSLSRPLLIRYFHTSYFSRLFFSIIYEYFHLLLEILLYFRSLMQGRYSIHAPLLVKTLLHHFVSQEKAPPGLYRSSGGGSVVIGLASMLILGTCL